ncbi:MAG: AAA family ATPase [Minicystis sp.]
MKIQHLTFLGVRGVRDAAFDLTDPRTGAPHDLVVVSGPAASGKTRFLEAIAAAKEAIAPYGQPSAGAPWIAGESSAAKLIVGFHLDEEEQTYAGSGAATIEAEATFFAEQPHAEADEGLTAVLDRYDHRNRTGKLEYFPASRRIPTHAPFHGTGALDQRAHRAGKDPRKYSFIPRFLREIEGNPAAAQAFSERLMMLSPTCTWERGAPEGGLPRGFRSRGGPPVTPAELSDGEANAVLFAATAVAIQLVRSIVLVDRPELHVDPAKLPRWIEGLRALGEGNQLILASSSPSLLAAAAGAHVVRLE